MQEVNSFLSCKEYTKIKKEKLKEKIVSFKEKPKLCVIQIGNDLASNSYIKGKRKDCEEVGIECEHVHIENIEDFSMSDLEMLIESKNADNGVDGIIVQLPIPKKYDVETVQEIISKHKDVDGFRRDSKFLPCTPKGVVDYLEYNDINLSGKICTVIGRSNIVGKPLVNLLIERGATVISCNSKTATLDLKHFTRLSDIVISAIGKPNYFTHDYFNSKHIIVDVGINRDENGRLCGDVCEDIKEYSLLSTPVPNGVGLLTRIALVENVVKAHENK